MVHVNSLLAVDDQVEVVDLTTLDLLVEGVLELTLVLQCRVLLSATFQVEHHLLYVPVVELPCDVDLREVLAVDLLNGCGIEVVNVFEVDIVVPDDGELLG